MTSKSDIAAGNNSTVTNQTNCLFVLRQGIFTSRYQRHGCFP